MTYKLIVAEEAHSDIDRITDYIALKLSNPIAAIGFLDDVERSYNKLIDNPFIYSLCRNERLRKRRYRFIVIKNYLIFYRVDEARQTVYILRIFHSSRNYMKLL